MLLVLRVLRPSYAFLLATKFYDLFAVFGRVHDPQAFERVRRLPQYQAERVDRQKHAMACLIRVMVRTGKPLLTLTGEELLAYADIVKTSGRLRREHLAWELMVALGPLAGEPPTLRAVWTAKSNSRQHSVATLVDRYGLPAGGVRDLLVDYLDQVKPGMDYSSLESLAYMLAKLFWANVLKANPEQVDLRLSPQTVTRWHELLSMTSNGKPREEVHSVLFSVRAFYRDLQQWALEDPLRWGRWAAPCPVRESECRAVAKARRQVKARMQERTRVLTPLLPKLVATAIARRDWSTRLLQAATTARLGETFSLDGVTYRRLGRPARHYQQRTVRIHDGAAVINVTSLEADCFWAWAVIETLRLSGSRIEELTELTQLSVRHHTPASTGKLVPLLHIAPSKLDIERLIPMSPDLVSVLLTVVRRTRGSAKTVPLSVRYDAHEKVPGQPLPHLFVHRVGTRLEVLSFDYIRTILLKTAAAASLSDSGQQVVFNPHDFRRLFTTDLIGTGLPLHIAAALLGHYVGDFVNPVAAERG
jgi:hypothetical protein